MNKPNEDVEFLNYLIELDAILRTCGWYMKNHLQHRIDEIVQILDDNGYDTMTRALYRAYGYQHPLQV